MRAETADGRFFDRYRDFMRGQQFADQILVQRFGEAQVSNGGGQSFGLQPFRCLLSLLRGARQVTGLQLYCLP